MTTQMTTYRQCAPASASFAQVRRCWTRISVEAARWVPLQGSKPALTLFCPLPFSFFTTYPCLRPFSSRVFSCVMANFCETLCPCQRTGNH